MAWSRLLLMATVLALTAPTSAGEYDQRRQQLEEVRERMQALEERLQQRHGRADRLGSELEEIEQTISRTVRRLEDLVGKREENVSRVDALESERRAREHDVAEHRAYLRSAIREAYIRGNQELLKVLLDQEDPAAVDRLMVYFDYLGQARRQRIEEAVEQLQRLAGVERQLEQERSALAELEERQRQRVDDLERQRGERTAVLARVQDEIADDSEALAELEADEAGLQSLLDELREELADIPEQAVDRPGFSSRRGDLPWPVEGQVAARFGSNEGRLDGAWQGVLLQADAGAPVRAVAHGQVVFANWLRGFGMLLIIDHGDGYMTLYGHNEGLYVDVGDWVEDGQVIAAAGDTGGRDRPGLYFELRIAGQPEDPLPWLRRRG